MSNDLKPLSVKAPMHLLPARALRALVSAIEHGALKYAPWNWQDTGRSKERIDELTAALMRHVTAAADPAESDYDDESGLHHMEHAGACVLIILHKLGLDYQPSTLKLKSMRKPVPQHCRIFSSIEERERQADEFTERLLRSVPLALRGTFVEPVPGLEGNSYPEAPRCYEHGEQTDSNIEHPPHYNRGSMEVIEIIEKSMEHVAMVPYPMVGFHVGNIIKYLLRFPAKGGVEDLKKARWYLERLISTMEG